ncbi:MAG: methyl-accepting chemotaxis protein [Bdellovibrio sp.]|jgi:methyl-accepting chemotaxis protein
MSRQMSLKFRMFLLIAALMSFQGVLVWVAITQAKSLLGTLHHVADIQLPATKSLAIADMHHDGIKGTVSQGLYYDLNSQTDKLDDVAKELSDHKESFMDIFANMQKLEISAELKAEILKTQEIASAYSDSASLIVGRLQKGQRDLAAGEYSKFNELFEILEVAMEKLTDASQAEAAQKGLAGIGIVGDLTLLSLASLVLSLVVSVVIFIWTRKSFEALARETSDVVQMVNHATTSVQSETHKMKASTVEQSAAIQESVSALAEMASMIGQTSQNVQLSLETSQGALNRTEEGKQIMDRMSHAMVAIQKSNTQLQDLSKVIENINSKTLIINDIVFKTQLLSFNASIEAARAGQHGRGFAVVAEEVGNLAELSGHAAKDIELLLSESQQRVKETLDMIQSRVTEGNKVSQLALESFNRISTQIEDINQQVRSINEATQQQQIGIDQTNAAMRQMNTSAQTNSQASSIASQRAEELGEAGQQLNHKMQRLTQLISGLGQNLAQDRSREENSGSLKVNSVKSRTSMQGEGSDLNQLVEELANRGIPTGSSGYELSADDQDFKKGA